MKAHMICICILYTLYVLYRYIHTRIHIYWQRSPKEPNIEFHFISIFPTIISFCNVSSLLSPSSGFIYIHIYVYICVYIYIYIYRIYIYISYIYIYIYIYIVYIYISYIYIYDLDMTMKKVQGYVYIDII